MMQRALERAKHADVDDVKRKWLDKSLKELLERDLLKSTQRAKEEEIGDESDYQVEGSSGTSQWQATSDSFQSRGG